MSEAHRALAFDIGLGVRKKDDLLRAERAGLVAKHDSKMYAVLHRSGIPTVPMVSTKR